MFHNYAFKECISVENLKLWLFWWFWDNIVYGWPPTSPALFSLLITHFYLKKYNKFVFKFFFWFFITHLLVQCAVVWRLTEYLKMKIKCASWFYLATLSSTFFALVNGLNFFTATVDPPDSQYSQLLSGNDVFETVYSTFNSTGLLLLGSALLLSSGK